MRIAMVSEHASPLAALGGVDAGGQNVHVAELARGLAARGVEVTVYTRRDDPSLPERVPICPGVVVEHVDAGPPRPIPKDELLPHMDDFGTWLSRRWQADVPDLVHAHFWMSGHAALAAAGPLDLPVIMTFHALGVVKRRHQGSADPSPPERLGTERTLAQRCERIIATCSDEFAELWRMDADPDRIAVVPCGVDLDLFGTRGAHEPRGPGRHRLVVVSRMVPRKGIDDVIRALPRLPGTELVIAGGPPAAELPADSEARRLLRLATRLDVIDRVDLRGQLPRDDVPALLRSADVVVCVPWYEPFGIVPLEAMACGVPVVASAVGGMLDTVVGGVTGVHVPARAPDVLAEALGDLLADAGLRKRLGLAGASRATGYGWEAVAGATVAEYQRVAGKVPAEVVGGSL